MDNIETRPRLAYQIGIAILCKLLLNTGRRFAYPFAPALSRDMAVPLSMITSLIAACQFSSLFGIFAGPLADRFGYRRIMQGGLALLVVGMLLCTLFPWYWAVLFGLVLASLGKTLFDPALQAYIGNHVEYGRRGRVIGFSETAWAGSTLLGIPLLGLSIEYLGLTSSYALLAGLALIGCFFLGRTFQSNHQATPPTGEPLWRVVAALGEPLTNRFALTMLVFGFLISVASDSLFVVYGAWFERDFAVSLVTLGFSTIAIGLAELLGESCTALLADRIGLKRAVLLGLVLSCIAYLALPVIGTSLNLAMLGIFFVFFAGEFTIVTSFSLNTELLPHHRATMLAAYFGVAGIGRMGGVLLGGVLWRSWGIVGVCHSSALLSGLALLVLLWGMRRWRPDTT
ncbi:MAG: MFS transporter [Desulfopila sp.]